MMDRTSQLLNFMDQNGVLLCAARDAAVKPLLAQLYDRLKNPRNFIVMAGETSSGKSTLINALCGKNLLPCSSTPTTGTIVQIELSQNEQDSFSKFNRYKAEEETISYQSFFEQARHPAKDILRLKAEVHTPEEKYRGMNVFDTPGFASMIKEHETSFRDFIPESDIIVYTATYRNGFDLVSREWMSMISDLNRKYARLPVLLAVNRCPAGTGKDDKRIREMKLAAEDSFQDSVELFLIENTEAPEDDPDAVKPLPDASLLWDQAAKLCHTQERTENTILRAKEYLGMLLKEQILDIQGQLDAAGLDARGIAALKEALSETETFERDAVVILEKYLARLNREIPRLLTRETSALKSRIHAEINRENKFLNAQCCAEFISGHTAPFGANRIAEKINEQTIEIFEQMDRELKERANKAVASIKERADTCTEPQLSALLTNLALRLGAKLAGETAERLLSGFGGVGGAAAGLGNLAKTIVSHVGKLFGKTFSREVYTQIGKIFTKRALAAISIAGQVLIDAAAFLWDAYHWQGDLIKKVDEQLDKWKDDVLAEFQENTIPAYRKNNLELFAMVQKEMTNDIQQSIRDAEARRDKKRENELLVRLNQLKNAEKQLEAI